MLAKPAKDMTVREEFAKTAMEGLLASDTAAEMVPKLAVALADDLMAELGKVKDEMDV